MMKKKSATVSIEERSDSDDGDPTSATRGNDRAGASDTPALAGETTEPTTDASGVATNGTEIPVDAATRATSGRRSLRARHRRRRSAVHGVISVVLAVTIWEVVAANTSPLVFVSLTAVGEALLGRIEQGLFWRDFSTTSYAFLVGYAIASVAGILIGLAVATSNFVHNVFQPWISALYSTPVVALAPLFIMTFGIGISSKIAVVVLLAIFPVIINTTAGIRDTEPHLVEGAYAFGASRLDIFRFVLIPSAVPYVITGLRLAVGRGLIGVVVAEFFGARAGLGHMVFQSSQRFDTATLFGGVLILALAGTLLINLMHRLERWIAPWRDFKIP